MAPTGTKQEKADLNSGGAAFGRESPPAGRWDPAVWAALGIGIVCGAIAYGTVSLSPAESVVSDVRIAAGLAFAVLGACGGVWLALQTGKSSRAVTFAAVGAFSPAAPAAIAALVLPPLKAGQLAADLVLYPAAAGAALSLCVSRGGAKEILLGLWRGIFLACAGLGLAVPFAMISFASVKHLAAPAGWVVLPAAFGIGNLVFLFSLRRYVKRRESRDALARVLERLRDKRKDSGDRNKT